MDYQKTLPLTGAGIVIGGTIIPDWWLVLAAIALIATGAVAIRYSFRHKKEAQVS